MPSHLPIVRVACGYAHCASIAADGRCFTWGDGEWGKLGHGDTDSLKKPRMLFSPGQRWQDGVVLSTKLLPVPFLVSDISLGEDHSVCVTLEGHLYSWGCNHWGVLGNGVQGLQSGLHESHHYMAYPNQVTFYEGAVHARVCRVAAGGCHTLCVNEYGQMYEWGRGLSSPEGASNVPWCHNGDADMWLSDDQWLRLRSPKLVTRFVKICIDCFLPSAVTARYLSESFEVEVLPHEMVDVVDITAGSMSKACLTSTGGEVP